MSRRDEIKLSDAELVELLEGERIAVVSSIGPRGWPHSMPMWFVPRAGEVWVWTYAKSQKVRNLERDPRATILVETGHEYGELRGAMIEAEAEIHRDSETVLAFAEELTLRYAAGISSVEGDAKTALEAQAPKRVAIRFRPARTATWDHRKLGGVLLGRYLSGSMRRSVASASVAALLATVLLAAPAAGRLSAPPQGFFGIAPQTRLTDLDAQYMAAGGIGSVRVPFAWSLIQPIRGGAYDWSSVDPVVEVTARAGLTVLPFLAGTPSWLARKSTTLPIYSAEARNAWSAFVRAAVERYGPGGSFWGEHTPETATTGGLSPIPTPLPVRSWQVWNEANFFYFAYPVSPSLYARLLKLTQPAIKAVDPDAEVILSGLFGDPDEGGQRGMDAADFLDALYRMPGIKSRFDAVALHPYAFHVDDLEALVEEVRQVVLDHHDPGAGLYITEMGWGSQNDPRVVAFEQGIRGQARELRGAYRYLLDERRRLNLEAAYWFSWKDVPRVCNFCDSVGLFRSGLRFKPKPAWNALVALTGGRARP